MELFCADEIPVYESPHHASRRRIVGRGVGHQGECARDQPAMKRLGSAVASERAIAPGSAPRLDSDL